MGARLYLRLCDQVRDGHLESADVVFEAAGGLAAVYSGPVETVVVFRGSGGGTWDDTLLNLWDDLSFRPTTEWQLHRGVLRHAQRIYGQTGLQEYVISQGRPVALTGMSLGGGAAALLPFWTRETLGPFKIVTFGSPLITKLPQEYSSALHSWGCSSIHNYVLRGDMLTNIPPFPGWSHVGPVSILPAVWGAEHQIDSYLDSLKDLNDA